MSGGLVMLLLKCLPFLFFAGLGTVMILTAAFPSWREPDWSHWKLYIGDSDSNPDAWTHACGLTKPPKPVAEGDWPDKTASCIYYLVGGILICIAFIGVRHFADMPALFPDILRFFPK